MNLFNRLSSNLLIRNALDYFGFGKPYTSQPGGFIPYFQYKIGPHEREAFYLCFDQEPFAVRYKNEVFNKLCRYTIHDGKRYLAYHFDAYPVKQEFLTFLRDELSERLGGYCPRKYRVKLIQALDWVNERRQEKPADLEPYLESLRPLLENLIDSYTVGNIQTNHQSQLKLVVQHLYLLRTLNSKKDNEKGGETLFPRFGVKDAASIMRLHFVDFRKKELNTVQKEVADIEAEINLEDPKTKRLYRAMQEFYFG